LQQEVPYSKQRKASQTLLFYRPRRYSPVLVVQEGSALRPRSQISSRSVVVVRVLAWSRALQPKTVPTTATVPRDLCTVGHKGQDPCFHVLMEARVTTFVTHCTERVTNPKGFPEMTIQPARYECHACCPLQAEKHGIQLVVGNAHCTRVSRAASSFTNILRGPCRNSLGVWGLMGYNTAL